MIRAIFLVFLIKGLIFGPQTSYSRMYEHEGGRYKEGLTYLVKLNLRDAWDESTVVLDDIQYKLKAAMDASDSHFGAMTHKAERVSYCTKFLVGKNYLSGKKTTINVSF